MPGQPRANRDDNTSLFVGLGMAALTMLGVFTVFGDALAAAFTQAPAPAVTGPKAQESARESNGPTPPSEAAPSANAPDAGGGKP